MSFIAFLHFHPLWIKFKKGCFEYFQAKCLSSKKTFIKKTLTLVGIG
jgi:hypothetical protein